MSNILIDAAFDSGNIEVNDLDRRRRLEDDELIAVITAFLIASRNIR